MSSPALPALLDRLFVLPRFGAGPGLHRMAALARALPPSLPHAAPETLKITGSNGKGAVAAMTAAILDELGLPCGLYTSPHLLHLHERLVVAGEEICDGELAAVLGWALDAAARYEEAHPGDRCAAFEVLTAAALHHFRRRGPAVVVAEAGIGGRLDSTRIFPGSLTALTSLDLEHTPLLGTTLEAIAGEKADLCPDGGTLVAGPLDPEILRRLGGALSLRGVRLMAVAEEAPVGGVEVTPEGTRFDLELAGGPSLPAVTLPGLEVALAGPHQAWNAALAVLLARQWVGQRRPELAAELAAAARRALRRVRWPGRFERLGRSGPPEPEVFADVGHTPAAICALAQTVAAALAGRPLVLVAGVSAGRDPAALLAPLLTRAAAVVCTRPRHRGQPAAAVAAALGRVRLELPVEVEEGVGAALERARRRARELDPRAVVLVAGGYFLAAEVLAVGRGEDPGGLRFF